MKIHHYKETNLYIFLLLLSLSAFHGIAVAGWEEGLEANRSGDHATALKELRPEAEKGFPPAQMVVGAMYYKGLGVPQNYKEAEKWFRMAAEQGFVDAQLALGGLYALGHGVTQNNVEAHMWLNLAAAGGQEEAAELRDDLAVKMTSSQIAQAQKLAREWFEDHQFDETASLTEQTETLHLMREQYIKMIAQKVENHWMRPASDTVGQSCEVIVTQASTGDIIDVSVQSCEGSAAFQESVERAVRKSSPLPLPPDQRLFESQIYFRFKPES